jgi:hypothetical protein
MTSNKSKIRFDRVLYQSIVCAKRVETTQQSYSPCNLIQ